MYSDTVSLRNVESFQSIQHTIILLDVSVYPYNGKKSSHFSRVFKEKVPDELDDFSFSYTRDVYLSTL